PMQWSDERQGGFSTARKTILPVIDHDVWSYKRINVEAQRRDPNSLLNWTERMIRLRKECPEFGWGHFAILQTNRPSVLAVRYTWRANSVLTIHNFDDKPQAVVIDLGSPKSTLLSNLIVGDHSEAQKDGKHHIPIEGYGYRWYRVGGLSHILKRD